MHTMTSLLKHSLSVGVVLTTLSACDWVDSTGVQSIEVTSTELPGNAVLRNAEPIAILEETSVTATLSGEAAHLSNWSWMATTNNGTDRCTQISGFDPQLAQSTLLAACSDTSQCAVIFDESANGGETQLTIRMPQLRAPVALSYQLVATRDDGSTVNRDQVLCALSVNEAPVANNDRFLALRNELRVVDAEDSDSLLKNDVDDTDIRNEDLHVIAVPVEAPRHAVQFSLNADGSFLYQASEDAPYTDNGFFEDTFIYAVTDGMHVVNATAIIKIVDDNQGPLVVRRIPEFSVASDRSASGAEQIDLSRYFFDPDNDPIRYRIDPDQLPASGNITLSSSGLLSVNPEPDDVGKWRFTLEATDGLASRTETFMLTINAPDTVPINQLPVAIDITNKQVRGNFSYDIRPFFSDPDNDQLSFSASGLPKGVRISAAGIISGVADKDSTGRWIIRVTADDGNGGRVSDGFALTIR